jgi:hypothetical protein
MSLYTDELPSGGAWTPAHAWDTPELFVDSLPVSLAGFYFAAAVDDLPVTDVPDNSWGFTNEPHISFWATDSWAQVI